METIWLLMHGFCGDSATVMGAFASLEAAKAALKADVDREVLRVRAFAPDFDVEMGEHGDYANVVDDDEEWWIISREVQV